MFEYQRATGELRAPDLPIPETDLQIVFGIVPQEFVEETDALRRGGIVLNRGTRDQVDQTHCKTKGVVLFLHYQYLSLTASASISNFLYGRGRMPEILRSCGVFYDENQEDSLE